MPWNSIISSQTLCLEGGQSILDEASARFLAHFLAGTYYVDENVLLFSKTQ